MIFFIGGIMVIVGITMAVLAATFVDAGYGAQASTVAEATAMAGAEDAYLQLVRNSTFSSALGYSLTNGSSTATVTVTQNSPVSGQTTAVSTATVNGRTRKVQAIFGVNSGTGQITVISWGDVL